MALIKATSKANPPMMQLAIILLIVQCIPIFAAEPPFQTQPPAPRIDRVFCSYDPSNITITFYPKPDCDEKSKWQSFIHVRYGHSIDHISMVSYRLSRNLDGEKERLEFGYEAKVRSRYFTATGVQLEEGCHNQSQFVLEGWFSISRKYK
ncbi:MAG: hypothetical protein Q9186_005670 [Xanthomendoza sp. 1 TL-2023]